MIEECSISHKWDRSGEGVQVGYLVLARCFLFVIKMRDRAKDRKRECVFIDKMNGQLLQYLYDVL